MQESPSAKLLDIGKIKTQALQVITNPSDFFRSMPRTGGYREPAVFLFILSMIIGLISSISLFRHSQGMAITVLVMTPLLTPLLAFVGAGLLFLVWKLMGSTQSYETAYRCAAYSFTIQLITAFVSMIPYVGGVVATAWGMYILYVASVEVHGIERRKARTVWMLLFVLTAAVGLISEIRSRKMQHKLEGWAEEMQGLEEKLESGEITPEDAERMVGEFLRSMEQGAEGEKPAD